MTHSRNTPASRPDSSLLTVDELADEDLDETSRQAWTEAMTVRPFGDAYLVDCADCTHYVTLDPSSCSCDDAGDDTSAIGDDAPVTDDDSTDTDGDSHDTGGDSPAAVGDSIGTDGDSAGTGGERTESDDAGANSDRVVEDGDDRCEHVRRVAIEINLGRVPPPAEHTVECAGCDRHVGVSVADAPPYLCPECHVEPGDVVVDTDGEAETPLLVVSEPGRPADLVAIPDEDRTVSEYPGNDRYPADTPVVEAVYPHAVSTERQPRRYLFPLTRLGKPDAGDGHPPELGPEFPSTLES